MLQLYSDKTNVTDKTQVYPIKVALLNLDYGCKRKHLGTLALIPVLKHLPSCSDADMAVARRDLLRQVLAIVVLCWSTAWCRSAPTGWTAPPSHRSLACGAAWCTCQPSSAVCT